MIDDKPILHLSNTKGIVFLFGKKVYITPPNFRVFSPDEVHGIVQRGTNFYIHRITEDGNTVEGHDVYFTKEALLQSAENITVDDLTEEDKLG